MGKNYFLTRSALFYLLIITATVTGAFNREIISLNQPSAGWKFIREDVSGAQNTDFNDDSWIDITIPHDFNGGIDGVHDDVFSGPDMYRGIGWYRTEFTVDNSYDGKKVFIEFEAVSIVSDAWVNGNYCGQHKGAYTSFRYDITDHINFNGNNVLAVKANSLNDNTVAPWMEVPFGNYPTSPDYAIYGGIYRDVHLIITDNVKIDAVYITTPDISSASSGVNVESEVTNHGSSTQSATLVTEIRDAQGNIIKTMTSAQDISAGQTYTFSQNETVSDPNLWSPETPYLYSVNSKIEVNSEEVDQVVNSFGFRWFEYGGSGNPVYLNGEQFFIRGINRHQDREGYGYALTNSQHVEDAVYMKKAGFNSIRHAHYPADPAFMDACDSLGFIVWLEIPITVSMSQEPEFLENAKEQIEEMIRQNFNHPSVFVWGIGNESDQNVSESFSNDFDQVLHNHAKSIDSTRPTTLCNYKYGSNGDIVDLPSPQDWSGWYGGEYTSYNPYLMIGEYGGSSDYGLHTENTSEFSGSWDTEAWSEEYICELLEYKVSYGESHKDQFPGHFVWILGDFASPRNDRNINPVPYMNQKGIMNHAREKKDAYYFYQSCYTTPQDSPMVYIVSHTWLDRWSSGAEAKDIWVYSNCDTVELYNGFTGETSFGKQIRNSGERGDTRFQWNDAYVENEVLYAEGIVDGDVVARDTIRNLQNLNEVHADMNNLSASVKNSLIRVNMHKGNVLSIHTGKKINADITLYSLSGRKIKVLNRGLLEIGTNNFRIAGSNTAAGIYYVEIKTGTENHSRKIFLNGASGD